MDCCSREMDPKQSLDTVMLTGVVTPDSKSTSGYLFQVGGTAITWQSKKQLHSRSRICNVSRSSTSSLVEAA